MNRTFVLLTGMLPLAELSGCRTLHLVREPLRLSLVTDSAEVTVYHHGNSYSANIPFTLTNTTDGPISRGGCDGPGWPDLEKKVDRHWVIAYYQTRLECRRLPDFSWDAGAQIHSAVSFLAGEPGQHTFAELNVKSIDGIYRLRWSFTEGRQADAKRARVIEAISNEFRMTLVPSAPRAESNNFDSTFSPPHKDPWLATLTIPPSNVGFCESGPFLGGLLDEPPPEALFISLHIGDPIFNGRDIRLLVDSAGRLTRFDDEVSLPRGTGVTAFLSVAAGFDSTGRVEGGMQKNMDGSKGGFSKISHTELPSSRFPDVVAVAAALRQRCGPHR